MQYACTHPSQGARTPYAGDQDPTHDTNDQPLSFAFMRE